MNKKKRYCIFAAQYFPHLGGVERYTYNLARKLIEEGNDVTIVTSNVYRIKAYEKVDGIPISSFEIDEGFLENSQGLIPKRLRYGNC